MHEGVDSSQAASPALTCTSAFVLSEFLPNTTEPSGVAGGRATKVSQLRGGGARDQAGGTRGGAGWRSPLCDAARGTILLAYWAAESRKGGQEGGQRAQ